MKPRNPSIRLFVDAPLGAGQSVPLAAGQAHYLRAVMRLQAGTCVALFNGRDGEWAARLTTLHKKGGEARAIECLRVQAGVPDLWLLFAPLKKLQTDFVVAKAVELGISQIHPIFTDRTVTTRINRERLLANCIEAAEQSERLCVPQVAEGTPLRAALDAWPAGRLLLVGDESGRGTPLADALAGAGGGPAAILVGPEGGFTLSELDLLRGLPFVRPVVLGPRILRAETAALAAIACWQAANGDWRQAPPPREE